MGIQKGGGLGGTPPPKKITTEKLSYYSYRLEQNVFSTKLSNIDYCMKSVGKHKCFSLC